MIIFYLDYILCTVHRLLWKLRLSMERVFIKLCQVHPRVFRQVGVWVLLLGTDFQATLL